MPVAEAAAAALVAVPVTAQVGLAASAARVLLRCHLVVATVEGMSMAPTYRDGDRLLLRRVRPGNIRAGQVVVAERPGIDRRWRLPPTRRVRRRHWMIKRAAAVPGDLVPRDQVPALRGRQEARVPLGWLVLPGDNAADSFDSRIVGYFPAERVLGVAVHTVRGRS